jgi:hypothetical protein
MKTVKLLLLTTLMLSLAAPSWAERGVVKFPENYAEGVRYATVPRGDIRQEIYTSQAAIDAVKNGQPIPSGTVITLVDYRDGKLHRYVVMEKRSGWGAGYPPELRNGEWEFEAFNADRTVNTNDDVSRCFACHKAQAQRDYVFTLDRIKTAR